MVSRVPFGLGPETTQRTASASGRPRVDLATAARVLQVSCLLALFWLGDGSAVVGETDPSPTAQAATAEVLQALDVGIAGVYKLGQWTPLKISLSPQQSSLQQVTLEVELEDSAGVPARYASGPFDVPAGSAQTRELLVKFGSGRGEAIVRLRDGSTTLTERRWQLDALPKPVPSGQRAIIGVGSNQDLATLLAQRGGFQEPLAYGNAAAFDELPTHWLGYRGVDVLFLTTATTSFPHESAAQWLALKTWVEQGGVVVWSIAAKAPELVQPEQPLAWLLPGRYDGVVGQRQTSSIEQFVAATRPLELSDSGTATSSLPMTKIKEAEGAVVASEGLGDAKLPIIIRSTRGLGLTVFVAFDVDVAPVKSWVDRPRLMARLLEMVLSDVAAEESYRSEIGPTAHVGFSDLVGQLRMALDQFAGVRIIPFSWIAALIGIYLLLIGPVDYLLLKRLGRPDWTWFSSTALIVGFLAIAVWLAFSWKGQEFRLNQVSVVDLDVDTGTLRGITWAHLYAPRTEKITLRTEPSPDFPYREGPSQVTSWQGLPGDGFGGLERADTTQFFSQPYSVKTQFRSHQAAEGELVDFPLAVWSSRAVVGQWWAKLDLPPQADVLSLGSDSVLSGSFVNVTPFDLADAYLVYNRSAIKLGSVKQNAVVRVNRADSIDLQTLLTQRKVVKGRNVVTPWDTSTTNLDRILSLMMYYEAAKGRAYTQLQHRFHRELDWSNHLTTNRAVLWGRCDQRGATVKIGEQPISQIGDATYCRLLLPIAISGD